MKTSPPKFGTPALTKDEHSSHPFTYETRAKGLRISAICIIVISVGYLLGAYFMLSANHYENVQMVGTTFTANVTTDNAIFLAGYNLITALFLVTTLTAAFIFFITTISIEKAQHDIYNTKTFKQKMLELLKRK